MFDLFQKVEATFLEEGVDLLLAGGLFRCVCLFILGFESLGIAITPRGISVVLWSLSLPSERNDWRLNALCLVVLVFLGSHLPSVGCAGIPSQNFGINSAPKLCVRVSSSLCTRAKVRAHDLVDSVGIGNSDVLSFGI